LRSSESREVQGCSRRNRVAVVVDDIQTADHDRLKSTRGVAPAAADGGRAATGVVAYAPVDAGEIAASEVAVAAADAGALPPAP
jgi:hypothetical protein